MIIALDIDGTLVKNDSLVYKILNACPVKFFGVTKNSSKILQKNVIYKKTILNKILPFLNPNYFYEIEEAKKVINNLHENNIIILLSSRPSNMKSLRYVTQANVKNINLKYDLLLVGVKNKEEFCKNNNVDVFIDNNPTTCQRVQRECKNTTICMTVGNKRAKSSDVLNMQGWREVEEYLYYINNIKNNKILAEQRKSIINEISNKFAQIEK